MEKRIYEIDGERFSTIEGFYDEISQVLIPGASWGRNLDAFNDILRGGFGTPDAGFVLQWRNSALSRERLGYPETIRWLQGALSKCHPSNRDSLKQSIDNARRMEGPTLFDHVIEIITIHTAEGGEAQDNVEFVLL